MAIRSQSICLALIVATVPRLGEAAAEDVQIGAVAMAARSSATATAHHMAGAGLALSYSPWWHYVVDVRANCLSSISTLEADLGELDGDDVSERYQKSQCDVVAGLSYRMGYPFALGSPTRFGLVIGLGAGYRRTTKHDRTAWSGATPGRIKPAESTWDPILSSRIGVEYRPQSVLSTGLYLFATSNALTSQRIEIEPAIGLLISGYFAT